MLFGIDVIVVAPGPVATPIWSKAEETDWSRYRGTPYGPVIALFKKWLQYGDDTGLAPETIGEGVAKALTAVHPRTRYALTPTPIQHFLVNHLPKRMVDRIMAKRLGMIK